MLDQFESSNLDLTAAFPSIGVSKPGRKMIKREQVARHVPALQPFREEIWRKETEQLEDPSVTTLGLFQEALAQSTPKVPHQLKSEDQEHTWWKEIPAQLSTTKLAPRNKIKSIERKSEEENVISSDQETEDEFENHENFKVCSF